MNLLYRDKLLSDLLSPGSANTDPSGAPRRAQVESGWALLGLMMALMVLGVLLVSVVPSVRFAVQRDKEEEMRYRGEQMAIAIGRYYNSGQLGAPQLLVPPARFGGFLLDLKKLRDGVTVGESRIKFVRRSALIDPMTNEEWEPVRARDPMLAPFLQAYAASTGNPIPQVLQMIAGPPPRLQRVTPVVVLPSGAIGDQANTNTNTNTNANRAPGPPQPGQARRSQSENPVLDDDDDDDDDDGVVDPLAHIFKDKDSGNQPGKSNIPIVGVRPKLKGPSVRALYGLTNYEQWIFIWVPDPQMPGINPNFPQRPGQDQTNRPRISQ